MCDITSNSFNKMAIKTMDVSCIGFFLMNAFSIGQQLIHEKMLHARIKSENRLTYKSILSSGAHN